MKPMNAAQTIRFNLGCDVSHGLTLPMPAKRKTVAYGRNLQAHFEAKRKVGRSAA